MTAHESQATVVAICAQPLRVWSAPALTLRPLERTPENFWC